MSHRVKLSEIQNSERPAGYLEACLSLGRLDGEWLELSEEAYRKLRERFNPTATDATTARLMQWANGVPPCAGCGG